MNWEYGRMQIVRKERQQQCQMGVDDAVATVLARIGSGQYPLNSQLPTCVNLATEFGTHKNVISKAFQQLASEGILDSRAGRGTYVTGRPSKTMARHATKRVRALLQDAARLARTSGLSLEQFLNTVDAVAKAAYSRRSMRVAFVECNLIDGRSLAAELQAVLSLPVRPLEIGDFIEAVARDSKAFDLAIVGLAHLREVEDGLNAKGAVPDFPVESIFTLPAADSISSVARLPRDGFVGIICTTQSALSTLSGLVRATNSTATVRSVLASNRAECARLLHDADMVLVTTAAQVLLDVTSAQASLVSVSFHIDQNDVLRIANRAAQTADGLARAA